MSSQSKVKIGFSALLLSLCHCSLDAAEIQLGSIDQPNGTSGSAERNVIWVEGEILPGDYERFLEVYRSGSRDSPSGKFYPNYLRIASPGGDLAEAIKIAEFIEEIKLPTIMAGPCNSACFFILVGSPKRQFAVTVGLHRPYFDRQYFANLSAEEAQSQYSELLTKSESWLKERYVSSFLIEKMISTPSFDGYIMQADEIQEALGAISPIHQEWIAAKCGFLTDSEQSDRQKVMWLDGYGNLNSDEISEIEPIDLRLEVMTNLIKARSLSSGYLDYLRKKGNEIDDCEQRALVEQRRIVLN